MNINRNFFIIRISKKLQQVKRNKITLATVGYLGIKYSESAGDNGFKVLFVEENSPAYKAGLKDGDVIVTVNKKKVNSFEDMYESVCKHPPGSDIEISYRNSLSLRKDELTTKKVTLEEKPLALDVPPDSQDFRFNLQFGEVVKIGDEAKRTFPEVNEGDMLLVHHLVEYKERTANDTNWNDWHLLEDDENYEYRFVQAEKEVLGLWRPNELDIKKAIIPFPTYVFCHSQFQKASIQMTESGIWIPDAWNESMEELQEKLDELLAQIKELNTNTIMHGKDTESNAAEKNMIKIAIDSINKERRHLTRKMHQVRLVDAKVMFVNPKTNSDNGYDIEREDTIICDASMLYPLDIMGTHYVLARAQYIPAIYKNRSYMEQNNNDRPMLPRPLSNRVIVEPDLAEEKTDGGIIIPETAKEKPAKGTIRWIGNGKKGADAHEMETKVGDRVMYSKYSGTEITLDKKDYLIMREDEILLVY